MVAIIMGISPKEVRRVLRKLFLTSDLSKADRAFVEKEIEKAAPEIAAACRYEMAASE